MLGLEAGSFDAPEITFRWGDGDYPWLFVSLASNLKEMIVSPLKAVKSEKLP
jgi:hypothetical protein